MFAYSYLLKDSWLSREFVLGGTSSLSSASLFRFSRREGRARRVFQRGREVVSFSLSSDRGGGGGGIGVQPMQPAVVVGFRFRVQAYREGFDP